MSTKMVKISVLAALVIMGLGIGFFVSIWTGGGSGRTLPGEAGADGTAAWEKPAPLPPGASDLVAIQPKQSLLNELVKELRYRIKECKSRELELARREKRMTMAESLLKDEAKKLENLRMQLVVPLTRLQEAIAKLEHTRIRISAEEKIQMQGIAQKCTSQSPENAAQTLSTMCENNYEEDAVKILYYMEDRQAGKLLDAIEDKALVGRLLLKIKAISEEG